MSARTTDAALDAVAAATPKAARGMQRLREATGADGTLGAAHKALIVACAAAVRGDEAVAAESVARAQAAGLAAEEAWAAPALLLLARGTPAASRLATALLDRYGPPPQAPDAADLDREAAIDYFHDYFDGPLPERIAFFAERAPGAFEGYAQMHQATLRESTALPPLLAELVLCGVNAAEYQTSYVTIHAAAAKRAGASEEQLLEAMLAVIPIAGVAVWPVAVAALTAE